jgi:pimeloyl-ACP methyl ester carboxylesterase
MSRLPASQKDFRVINGRSLYIESYGLTTGAVIVLLHHGLGSTRAWKEQIPVLVQAGYRVITYDRWGYGLSEPRNRTFIPEFLDDLEDLRTLTEILDAPQLALIGHSDGGTIASYFAARFPVQVTCLMSVAAHIYIESKMETGIQAVKNDFEKDALFREGLRRLHGDKYEQVFSNWYGGWLKPENLCWDIRPILHKIACPALIIQGMEDEHATPQHAHDMAASIPNAELWLVHGARHMFPQEQPEMFNRRVVSFLEQKCLTKS